MPTTLETNGLSSVLVNGDCVGCGNELTKVVDDCLFCCSVA